MRKVVGLSLAVLMVGLVVWYVVKENAGSDSDPSKIVAVKGVVGSEKEEFFDNPKVQERFEKLGYKVTVDTAGSREIADPEAVNLANYDFAFPSSAPAADKILAEHSDMKEASKPFFSPMVVATWQPVAELLTESGIMKDVGGQLQLDVAAYLAAVQEGKRWSDLPGYEDKYPANKVIAISTTDVRTSNSAAMHQALVSYVANNNRVVASNAEADAVQPAVDQVFMAQGYVPSSSKEPMENYLKMGMGKAPMVFCYESQLIEAELAGELKPDMVTAQPSVSVYSQHTAVSRTEPGFRVGELLATDEELQKLAAKHGFRPQATGVFEQTLGELDVTVPQLATNVIDPPAYEFGERMIEGVTRKYEEQGMAPPADDGDAG